MQFKEKPLNSYSESSVFDNILEIGDVMTKKGRLRFERILPSEASLKDIIKNVRPSVQTFYL